MTRTESEESEEVPAVTDNKAQRGFIESYGDFPDPESGSGELSK